MSWDGPRLILRSVGLDEMERIGDDRFSVAVPIEADPLFKAMIFAAGKTHSIGNTSIDYVLRRYGNDWISDFHKRSQKLPGSLTELLLKVRSRAEQQAGHLSAITISETKPVGSFFAANALIRLQSTFMAALQLINSEFYFETKAVLRLGFEQICWAVCISSLNEINEVMAVSPAATISKLKTLFGGAGHIYGVLSELAHISPKVHDRYIELQEDRLSVKVQIPERGNEGALLMLILLDAYIVVSEYLFADCGIPNENLESQLKLAPLRECSVLLNQYRHVLPDNALELFQRWQT